MPQSRAVRPLLLVAALVAGAIHAPRARADTASDPVPVLPGSTILSPGPRALGFKDGLAADPSTIGNFRGLVALAYMRGSLRGPIRRRGLLVQHMPRLAAASLAFAGLFFRHERAQGTFSGAEGGFDFASAMRGRARSTFAELGTEQNGSFLAAGTRCPRCRAP